jgi:signal transduction histidine kinase/CheY-like chemotaxis protein
VSERLILVRLRHEQDVVLARRRARQIAAALEFDVQDQTRIATAVSELARNAVQYGGGGTVDYRVTGERQPQVLQIVIADEGGGIPHLDTVLDGRYQSPTGMGLGIIGARRLMDGFEMTSTASGTTVTVTKLLPARAPLFKAAQLGALTQTLAAEPTAGPIEEIQHQNRELIAALETLRTRQEELERVNRELEDTNRGVVALYAELEERADHLRRADDLKTRFLSNMTHEFRTPVNSILALTSLLAERVGASPEQKDEVFYIRKSAQQLADLVDDLLDIAKVEAGKIEVRAAPFEVDALFGALRGMLRPLLTSSSLTLTFEEPEGVPPIFSDESKVSQILRNFISNALKYTERGEVRVSAALTPDRAAVEFSVADTGIGIPATDLSRVFDEFAQIENPLQRRVKGTGLGLPLSKRLAALLGGSVSVTSEFGVGSIFSVRVPLVYRSGLSAPSPIQPGRVPVLVVEDSDEDLLLYERALSGTRYQVVPARSTAAAVAALDAIHPAAIILDIRLQGQDSWEFLARVKRDERTTLIPLILISAFDDRQKATALGADACALKPIDKQWVLDTLNALVPSDAALRVLTVDDEETYRFIVREMLNGGRYRVDEAGSGQDGVRLTRELMPDVVLLDHRLSDMSGLDVYERLRDDPRTARVPVILVTSQQLSMEERRRFGVDRAVLSKSVLTRDVLRGAIEQAVTSV